MTVVGALALAIFSVAATGAAAEGVVKAKYLSPDQEALEDYWTPERMRNAKPIGFPAGSSSAAFSGSVIKGSTVERGDPLVIPPDPPPESNAYSVSPDFETNPAGDTVFPQSIHGKIFASLPAGDYTCSGTVTNSPMANLVVTAGHCVFGQGVFASNFIFVPGYRYGNAPLGQWPAAALYTTKQWVSSNAFDGDVGMVRIAPVNGVLIQGFLGARGIAFGLSPSQSWDIIGYPGRPNPGSDGFGDYDGQRLIFCDDQAQGNGNFTRGFEAAPNEESIGSAYCFMQQGSSGGGWIIPPGGILSSVVSHGYCQNDPTHTVYPGGPCGLMFGPYFGTEEQDLYNQATTDPARSKCKKKKKKRKRRSASSAKKKKKKKCKKK